MNQFELFELMTVHGFYRFLGVQAHLPLEEVKKIYLLGRPWGVWPPDIDISREAAQAGIDVFTYLAALQPLIALDTEQKESELLAYEMDLSRDEEFTSSSSTRSRVERVAALATEKKQTICDLLHALYDYRQRVGALSVQRIADKSVSIANLQRGIPPETQRRAENDGGLPTNRLP